jgi:predicted phosphodiesterase
MTIMTHKIESIKEDIINIYQSGGIQADAARFIMEKTGLGKSQSKEWARRIYNECLLFGSADNEDPIESEWEEESPNNDYASDLEFSDKYVYNKAEDTYLFLLEKRFGKNIIVSGPRIRGIISNYSNYDDAPESINQVSTKYEIPRNYLLYILKVLGVTHDSLPFSPEEVVEDDIEELKEKYITGKKFALNQKLQKESWRSTKEDARRWNEFIVGKYNPFIDALDAWSPPKTKELIVSSYAEETSEKVFLCVLTDTHIGELTKRCWDGNSFDTEKATANIFDYLAQIKAKMNEFLYRPANCKLVIMGDILNSCVDGMTRKGTHLSNDIINGEMFSVGLDVVISFVSYLRQIFDKVDISCVQGNHDSFMAGAVYYSASRFFEQDPRIVWNISNYWLDSFKINNCYFIYSHGKDDVTHVAIPKSKHKFESFVQSLLLKKVEELVGVKSKYFICGHLHSYEHIESNDFEKIQVPSSVTADEFAEALGYMTKARQNCFIVGEDSIEETLHFYFD